MPGDLGDLSRLGLATRRVNVLVRQSARLAAWRLASDRYPRPVLAEGDFPHLLFARSIPIGRSGADARLERGKLVNVALAAPHIDGAVVAPDRPFSFWRAV